MRALFVSRDYRRVDDGGSIVTKRNLSFLKRIFGDVDEILKPKAAMTTLAKNIVLNQGYGATNEIIGRFSRCIRENEYDIVWFDGSCDGSFVKHARRHGIPTFTFYHNIEADFYKSKAETSKRLLDRIFVPYIRRAERDATVNSTYRILLNERDSLHLESIYGKKGDFIFPTSFPEVDAGYLDSVKPGGEPYLLFVGSDFWANEEGMSWFFENVAPHTGVKIKVIGSICRAFQNKRLPENVELLGRVENLEPYYADANAVISPILSGSGTKTKTIEALRYGKTLIASREALMGVPARYYDEIGYLCETPEEYIRAIGASLSLDKINRGSLRIFSDIFSDEAVFNSLKTFVAEKLNH